MTGQLLCTILMTLSFENVNNICPQHSTKIVEAANKHEIDPLLLTAILYHESKFVENAKGKHGECGMGQQKPSTAGMKCSQLMIAENSINKTAQLVNTYYRKANSYEKSLSIYNAGKVSEAGRKYAKRIFSIRDKLKKQYKIELHNSGRS